jgi:hypothetical protein
MCEKSWSTPLVTIHRCPDNSKVCLQFMQNWLRKTLYGLCRSCGGIRDPIVAASHIIEPCKLGHRILSSRIIQTCNMNHINSYSRSYKHVGWVIQTCTPSHTNLLSGYLWSYKILNSKNSKKIFTMDLKLCIKISRILW